MVKRRSQAESNVVPENKEMHPHIAKGLPPPFHELGEYTFQDLSTELFAKEPGIKHSRVFGDRGQRQFGIDVIADTVNGDKEVGQCKRYKTFSQQDIIHASDDFFTHWDIHWK